MSWEYRPQLDGLRTVAVYLVVLFHAGIGGFDGAFIGVDLFFVLSGFLVTNVILAEVDRHGTFSLPGFYARRVRRLLPAAVLVIVATCGLLVLLTPEPSRIGLVADARAALLYVANWQFIIDANDYFGQDQAASPFLHFWSLSIEEQFYVVFPLLAWVLLAKLGRGERTLGVVIGALLVVSVGFQLWAAATDVNLAYYATHTRVYQLLAGALLAILLRRETSQESARIGRKSAGWAAVAGVAGVVVLGSNLLDLTQSQRGLWTTLAAAAAIGGASLAPRSLLSRALGSSVPRYLGQISYGTYLWHWPVILAVTQLMPMTPWGTALVAGTIASGLAALSYQVFETPIRRARPLDRVRWPVVVSGLGVSAFVAVAVVPVVLESERQPVVTAAPSGPGADAPGAYEPGALGALPWADDPVPDDLDFAALAADEGELGTQCAEGTAVSCLVTDGAGPHVVLVGDSHAAMLAPAFRTLAEERDLRFSSVIRNNCPWAREVTNLRDADDDRAACQQLKDDFYDSYLPEMEPDLVVLVQKGRDGAAVWERGLVAEDDEDHPDETHRQMLLRTAADSVRAIRTSGARVLIVHSMFGTNGYELGGTNPLDCLSTARVLGDCAVASVPAPPIDGLYTYLATRVDDVFDVDLRDLYCDGGALCAPIVDGVVTWKDKAHLSTDYVVGLRDRIWTSIEEAGALKGLGS